MVMHPDDVLANPSIGPGICLPDMPDFAEMAQEQCQMIESYETFNEVAIGFFAPKIDEEAVRYCRELRRAYEEYASHLETTYRAALSDRLVQVELRLASLPYMRERIGHRDESKEKGNDHEL